MSITDEDDNRVVVRGEREHLTMLWHEQVAIYNSQGAASYYGLAQTERHFGLGKRASVDVEVRFHPSGKVVRRPAVEANQTVVVPE